MELMELSLLISLCTVDDCNIINIISWTSVSICVSSKKDAAVDSIDVKLMCQRLHGLGFVPPPCAPVFSGFNNVGWRRVNRKPKAQGLLKDVASTQQQSPAANATLWTLECQMLHSAGNHWKSEVSGAIVGVLTCLERLVILR